MFTVVVCLNGLNSLLKLLTTHNCNEGIKNFLFPARGPCPSFQADKKHTPLLQNINAFFYSVGTQRLLLHAKIFFVPSLAIANVEALTAAMAPSQSSFSYPFLASVPHGCQFPLCHQRALLIFFFRVAIDIFLQHHSDKCQLPIFLKPFYGRNRKMVTKAWEKILR